LTKNQWLFVLAGVFIGLSSLARPTALLPALGIIIFLTYRSFRHHDKSRKRIVLIFILSVITAIAPVTIRNYIVSGDFVGSCHFQIPWQSPVGKKL